MPGPLSKGGPASSPNDTHSGDRERQEGGKKPDVSGGFLSPPNDHAPMPGWGGKV